MIELKIDMDRVRSLIRERERNRQVKRNAKRETIIERQSALGPYILRKHRSREIFIRRVPFGGWLASGMLLYGELCSADGAHGTGEGKTARAAVAALRRVWPMY